ncbi:MAG: hypothetical protein K2K80_00110, partial [Clostridia bacterium]|nr:hypothetical protein [Clostridia bacterium]
MKRKILVVVFALIAVFACVFGFSACSELNAGDNGEDDTQTHEHSYVESVVEPTCTEKGFTLYTCTCGESYKDNYINANGHTEATDEAISATCTETGLTEGKHCSVCNTVLVKQEVVPFGHTEVIDKAV